MSSTRRPGDSRWTGLKKPPGGCCNILTHSVGATGLGSVTSAVWKLEREGKLPAEYGEKAEGSLRKDVADLFQVKGEETRVAPGSRRLRVAE
jgi:hypothetical protein